MISVEKYIEVKELPIKELQEFIKRRNLYSRGESDYIVFTEGDWCDLMYLHYSTFGELFDDYKRSIRSCTSNIIKAVNKMIISYLHLSTDDISSVGRKILPQGQEVKYTSRPKERTIHDFFLDTRKDFGTIIMEEVVANLADPMLDPNLILVIQQIIDDMEEKRNALEATSGGEIV